MLCGCVSYGEHRLADMSNYELCEALSEQRMNLDADSRQRIAARIAKMKVDCGRYDEAIRAQRAEDLYDRVYRNQSP